MEQSLRNPSSDPMGRADLPSGKVIRVKAVRLYLAETRAFTLGSASSVRRTNLVRFLKFQFNSFRKMAILSFCSLLVA